VLINEAGNVSWNIFLKETRREIVDYIGENGRIIEIELVSYNPIQFTISPFKIESFSCQISRSIGYDGLSSENI
jgi:hypothetical protein